MQIKKKNLISCLLAAIGGIFLGSWITLIWISSQNKTIYSQIEHFLKQYERFEEIQQVLNQEYVDQKLLLSGEKSMLDSAVKAYVDGLGDPYTTYLDAVEFSGLQHELEWEGQIEGIWAVVGKKEYYIQIEEVIKGSPAFKAGLLPLDRIITIGTGETKNLTTYEAVSLIRGKKWTKVKFGIERPQNSWENQYLVIEVERDTIDVPSVRSKILTHNNQKIWYIEISIFWEQTNKLLTRAISDSINENVSGIILDLRGNGGGLLPVAVDLAGHFLEPWTLVVKTDFYTYQKTDYRAKGFGELKDFPIVVLIDKMSASASEILALALREQGSNVKILGTSSFWKGTIQTLKDFDDQTSLKYTVGKRFWPQWTSIDKIGITPDIEVAFDMTGYIEKKIDNQLEKALEVLTNK